MKAIIRITNLSYAERVVESRALGCALANLESEVGEDLRCDKLHPCPIVKRCYTPTYDDDGILIFDVDSVVFNYENDEAFIFMHFATSAK